MKSILCAIMLAVPAVTAGAANRVIETRPPIRVPLGRSAKFDSAHSYDVQSYTLRIAVPMTNDSLYGHQRLTAIARTAGLDTVALNCVNLTIDSVKQDGSARGFRQSGDTLRAGIAPATAGDHFSLDIFYRGGSFVYGYYWYPQGGQALRTVSYTMSAPQDARYWMPCFDEPWDKADSGCVFYITAPDAFKTAANGLLADTIRSGGSLTWQWHEDYAIATYLMAFHVSQYAFWSDTARTTAGDTIPLNYFVWAADSAASRAVFDSVPVMMDCYSQKFGRYPFAKYGMAAAAPFMFGGMENQGMTTIHRDWITANDQYGIAHELAHMWYGDMVTCGTWADIWLNEGFGSYCEALYYEHITGNAPGQYMKANFSSAFSGNAEAYPIYNPPMSLIYDYSMEYAKGAWVLHMLRGVMSDSLFFPMMRAYADSFAYRCAVTADFQRIAEHHYGSSLQWFFNEWVYRAGHPTYRLVAFYKTRPDSNSAYVRLRQSSTTGDLFTMPVQLACSTRAGILPDRLVLWDSTAISDSIFYCDTLPVKRFLCDPDYWILQENLAVYPRIRNIIAGNRQLRVIWNAYTADSRPVSGYCLYRGNSSAGPFARVNQEILADTACTDTGLVNGTRYYYAVTALSGSDTCYETKFSNIASRIPTGVEGGPVVSDYPFQLALHAAHPNPFRQGAAIGFSLSRAGNIRLSVYNILGQKVKTLAGGYRDAGHHRVVWNGDDESGAKLSSGSYFCRLEAEDRRLTVALRMVR